VITIYHRLIKPDVIKPKIAIVLIVNLILVVY